MITIFILVIVFILWYLMVQVHNLKEVVSYLEIPDYTFMNYVVETEYLNVCQVHSFITVEDIGSVVRFKGRKFYRRDITELGERITRTRVLREHFESINVDICDI